MSLSSTSGNLTKPSSHQRLEQREGTQRPTHRDYYYIDFHVTIDAIKFKVFHLTKKVNDLYRPSEEKKDYRCPRCKAEWAIMEVLNSATSDGFLCHRCGALLQQNEKAGANSRSHEKSSKLMEQIEKLLDLLKQIDSADIPQNDFETAFSHTVPIQRDEYINPPRQVLLVPGKGPPATVKGLSDAALTPLEVSLTTNHERTAAEQIEEEERKAAIANSNVLPVWHTNSTITGESTVSRLVSKDGRSLNPESERVKSEEKDQKSGVILDEELNAYYTQMAEERQKEAREDADLDQSEEDVDDFEDVGIEEEAKPTPEALGQDLDESFKEKPNTLEKEVSFSSVLSAQPDSSDVSSSALGGDDPRRVKKIKMEGNGFSETPTQDTSVFDVAEPKDDEDDDFEDAI